MSQETLHLLQGYFAKAARRLQRAQPDEILPLLRTGITRMLHDVRSNQIKQMIPLLRDYFVRTFPELEEPAITNFYRHSTGWENETYAFTLTYGPAQRRMAEELILCVYPGASGPGRADTEYQALTRLAAAGYPTPAVKRYAPEGDSLSLQRPFTIMERVEGRRMLKPLLSSSGEEQKRLVAVYCGLLAQQHATDWRILAVDPAALLAVDPAQVVIRHLTGYGADTEGDMPCGFQRGWEWIVAHGAKIASPGLAIVHGDFQPNNIILRDGPDESSECAVVVDWTSATVSDYRFDLAWPLPILYRHSDGALRSSILAEYERQSGRKVENIEFFEVIACFARLRRVYAVITEGAARSGARAGVEETMRGQLPILRQLYDRYRELTDLAIPELEELLTPVKA